MRLANHLILLFVMLFVAGLLGSVEAQADDVPYLYYFSREFNAFLIERADGTDRHWLGQGLAREGASNIDGPGWSPSGQWLAWTENRFTTEQNHGDNPFVIHADGTRRLTPLDDFNDAVLAWAPGDDDILLVAGTKNELVGESDTIVYLLVVDMTTETVLTTVEVQRPARKYYLSFEPEEVHYLSARRPVLKWMPDGDYAAVFLEGMMDYDGNELAPNALYILDLTGGVEVGPSPSTYTDQPVSARGFVAYRDENGQLVLEHMLSGQREIVTVEGGFYFTRMPWSPDGRYLLAQGNDRGLHLVDTTDFTVTLLAERSSLETYSRYNGPLAYWSPNSDYVVFASQSAEMPTIFYLYLYELATQNTTQLPVNIDYGDPAIELGNWYWTSPDEIIFAMWHDADRVWELTQYQVGTGSTRTASTSGQQASLTTAYLSPSGRYLAYFAGIVGFQDVQTGVGITYPPDSRSYMSNTDGEIEWYPGDTWALLYEDAVIAGGGGLRWTGVARSDGSLRRELGWCSGQGQQCIGWLPPQVDVDTLPIAPPLYNMTEPIQEIAGAHWNYYLNWSPDGTYLVAGADGHGNGTLTVWNLAEHRVVETISVDENTNLKDHDIQIEWQPDYTLHFIPDEHIYFPGIYSPDERFYVDTGSQTAGVYDASTNVMLHPLDIGNFNYALSFTNDGRFLAVIHDEFPAHLLDTETWETVLTFDTHATAAAFSPDNTQLALANGWNVQLWDMRAFYESIGYESAD